MERLKFTENQIVKILGKQEKGKSFADIFGENSET